MDPFKLPNFRQVRNREKRLQVKDMKWTIFTVAVFLLTSCSGKIFGESKGENVTLAPKSGTDVKGTLTLKEEGDSVRVSGLVSGMTPGTHAMHIHEKGDCSTDDATGAGDHFGLPGTLHGQPDAETAHQGDLGNITAGPNGQAVVNITKKRICLGDKPECSIEGKAIIVHEKPDDFRTQPSGNSGARIACGVIPSD
jgi:superoxide dismutase, Cu-Zn family